MSFFSDLAAEASATHDEIFGDDLEYRATSDDSWATYVGRLYNERVENRKTEKGWNRVLLVDISVTSTDFPTPILHGQIRTIVGDDTAPILTIIEHKRLRTDRWILTCKQTKAGEISRPKLRR